MKTVGFPNRVSFETGPYFAILLSSHSSAVLVRMARRRPRLSPIKGIPSDPGGSFLEDFLLLTRKRKMVMSRKKMTIMTFVGFRVRKMVWSGEFERTSQNLYVSNR